jgi:hypothetical protein
MRRLVNRAFLGLLFLTMTLGATGSRKSPQKARCPFREQRICRLPFLRAVIRIPRMPKGRFSPRSTNTKSLAWARRTGTRISTILFSGSSAILPFRARRT